MDLVFIDAGVAADTMAYFRIDYAMHFISLRVDSCQFLNRINKINPVGKRDSLRQNWITEK